MLFHGAHLLTMLRDSWEDASGFFGHTFHCSQEPAGRHRFFHCFLFFLFIFYFFALLGTWIRRISIGCRRRRLEESSVAIGRWRRTARAPQFHGISERLFRGKSNSSRLFKNLKSFNDSLYLELKGLTGFFFYRVFYFHFSASSENGKSEKKIVLSKKKESNSFSLK